MVDAFAVFQAFAAGVLSFFAPCSIAMLPAYIGYYLGRDQAPPAHAPEAVERVTGHSRDWRPMLALGILGAGLVAFGLWDVFRVGEGVSRVGAQQLGSVALGTAMVVVAGLRADPGPAWQGARLGLTTSLGILAVFGLLGLPVVGLLGLIDFETQSLFVLSVAGVMVALGLLGLAGKDLSINMPFKAPRTRDSAAFLTFGVGYGLVAMGCNLPLFLFAALGPIVRAADPVSGVAAMLAYGAGMALLMVVLSVSLAVGKGLTQQRVRAIVPKVKKLSYVVLIVAGAYIAWYDWTVLRLGAA